MNVVLQNIPWMSFNLLLALIPVVLSYPLLKNPMRFKNLPILFLWFIFLPNTIYLLTDTEHFMAQLLYVNFPDVLVLLLQYALLISLGVLTYFLSLIPVEWYMRTKAMSLSQKSVIYAFISFIMAFGVVLGKVQRTHSWLIVTNPMRVVIDVWNTVTSLELILLTAVLGTLISVIILPFFMILHCNKSSAFLPKA